ncbi:hypothetical protein [Piscinibacter defluvii]|uniref:hypothetical protein n=1 Tax=Piscinibacter defluvii TaxID=1796922 RepID=UPI000FDF47BC|nr:hypothetical protein [Piscinibacter defluvii]
MPDALSLSAKRSGRLDAAVAQLRDIPERVIPYAANGAINIVLSRARRDIQAEMPRVFDRPNAYTLNSPRVIDSKRETLTGRVFVKDDAANNGTRPEDYLLPNVFGGGRKEKRFERNLRYAGILREGWRVVPSTEAKLDSFGNIPRGEIQRILTAVRASFDRYQNRSDSARSRRNARNAPYFVAGLDRISIVGGEQVVTRSKLQPGIYRRDGRGIKPVFVFVKKPPQYRQRLDFARVVEARADADFVPEFVRLANAITSKPR